MSAPIVTGAVALLLALYSGAAAERLVQGWVTSAPPRDRAVEIRKHIERSRLRFGKEPKRTPIDPIR